MTAGKEDLAILQARAAGNHDLADGLEKQKELHQEITALMGKGLSYA